MIGELKPFIRLHALYFYAKSLKILNCFLQKIV